MKLGLVLPSRESVLWHGGATRSLLDIATAAEHAGWDSVWAGESIVARPRPDPIALLAAVAGRTSRVTLGTAVLLPLLRSPLLGAHSLATVHELSEGRLVVGVGPGASIPDTDAELRAVGAPVGRRVSRLLDTVAAWRAAWGDGPPVWLAAAGPRTLALTGTTFDGWLPYPPTASGYTDGLDVVRRHAAGRPVTAGVYLTVALGEPDAAAAELEAYLLGYYGVGRELMGALQACFAGRPADAAHWIRSYVDAGAEHVVVRIARRDLRAHPGLAESLLAEL